MEFATSWLSGLSNAGKPKHSFVIAVRRAKSIDKIARAPNICSVCGATLAGDNEFCPVCALQVALKPQSDSISAGNFSSELHFEHYRVLQNSDGTPIELGHGAMGVTYKALDIHLQCAVALKIISARLIGGDSARQRFVREARAAARVRHTNVAYKLITV